jgi:hypothetical protein
LKGEEVMTEREALELVGQNGYALKFVPDELRTPETCEKAVEQDGLALEYVPCELRSAVITAVKMRRGRRESGMV